MDRTTFRTEIKRIVSDNELSKHPYVELVSQGRASREQLKGYPLQHYDMRCGIPRRWRRCSI
jgi:pyrroloquinoline quinone (PQQ) biosynthesis protein C